MVLWDNLNDAVFNVVVNSAGQRSLWPAGRHLPGGWRPTDFSGPREACLAHIDGTGTETPSSALPAPAGPPRIAPPDGTAVAYGARRSVPGTSVTALVRAQDIPADRLAATHGKDRITRGELLNTAAAWAHVLAEAGCHREVPVAVLLPRGLDALTAVLSVLDSGGAYLPLSCELPLERTEAILRDSGTRIVIATEELADRLAAPGRTTLTVRQLRATAPSSVAAPTTAGADDLAFVFYTSGTTGEPKGVEGTHRQLVNYALWCGNAFDHRPAESTFLSASLFFLGSLTTIFTPLLKGWPLTVVPEGATTDALLELSTTVQGGLLKLTPTHVRMMTARGVPITGLARQLMVGSEALTFTGELREWMAGSPERVVVNHYGLTETHGCFCHWLGGSETVGSRVPVGRPIDNVDAYVVDSDGEPVGIGEVGELLVAGPSLGRGYRNRPGLTAQRWIPDPWASDGSRLLRTGDLARMDADGVTTVLGRADRQVKIRGHRVEPSAVEQVLRGVPGVEEALVLPRTRDGRMTLEAFLLHGPQAAPEPHAAKSAVEALYPPQWVPTHWAVLSAFPVNANGKVDTQALPEPLPLGAGSPHPSGGPNRWSRTHRIVAGAYSDVLDIDEIGLHDSFYALGGDSLAAVNVAARIGRELGHEVPVPSSDAATVQAYAERIGATVQVHTEKTDATVRVHTEMTGPAAVPRSAV
ncbi:amino acid adenylation domain-containing protein [Streptomyces sp. NPDC002809]|uniref:amino acid adenylation domain-containing protein n=1 Tax=Streptomyces sp. NPDC002809 TaxID=3154433 RepID=UPI003317817C